MLIHLALGFFWGLILPLMIFIFYFGYRYYFPIKDLKSKSSLVHLIVSSLITADILLVWWLLLNNLSWAIPGIASIIVSTILAIIALYSPVICLVIDEELYFIKPREA